MKIMMGVHCSIGSRGCWSTTIKPQADTTPKKPAVFLFVSMGSMQGLLPQASDVKQGSTLLNQMFV
jgi:hypothetical protein